MLPILILGWAILEENFPRFWFWRLLFLYMTIIICSKYTFSELDKSLIEEGADITENINVLKMHFVYFGVESSLILEFFLLSMIIF